MSLLWVPLDELSEYPELEKTLFEEPTDERWAFDYERLKESRRQRARQAGI